MALVEIEDEDDAATGSYDAKTRDSHNEFLCTELALPQKLTHYPLTPYRGVRYINVK